MDSKEFVEFIRDYTEYEPAKYSGRGMYGRQCVSITHDSPEDVILDILQAKAENAPEEVSQMIDMLRGSSQDSMGRSSVIYWPNVKWPEETTTDEDDETEE